MNFIFGSSLPRQWLAGRLPKLENVKCGGHVSITRGKSFQHALIPGFPAQREFQTSSPDPTTDLTSFSLQSFSLQSAELQFAELQFAQLQFAGLQFGELRSKKQSFRLQSFSLQMWIDSEKMSRWKAVS